VVNIEVVGIDPTLQTFSRQNFDPPVLFVVFIVTIRHFDPVSCRGLGTVYVPVMKKPEVVGEDSSVEPKVADAFVGRGIVQHVERVPRLEGAMAKDDCHLGGVDVDVARDGRKGLFFGQSADDLFSHGLAVDVGRVFDLPLAVVAAFDWAATLVDVELWWLIGERVGCSGGGVANGHRH